MASVKFEKDSHEWHMFQDYWKLCQKFWVPENNDEYWKAIVRETDDFYEKYKDITLSKKIALAFVDAVDEKLKTMKE